MGQQSAYRIAGNEPPIQGPPAAQLRPATGTPRFARLDERFARAQQQVSGWTAVSVRLQNGPQGALTFAIDRRNGGRPDLRSQLTLDTNGTLVRWSRFPATTVDDSYVPGLGSPTPAFGSLGQTVAATASAGASLLVLTGLSLAVRRQASTRSENPEPKTGH